MRESSLAICSLRDQSNVAAWMDIVTTVRTMSSCSSTTWAFIARTAQGARRTMGKWHGKNTKRIRAWVKEISIQSHFLGGP